MERAVSWKLHTQTEVNTTSISGNVPAVVTIYTSCRNNQQITKAPSKPVGISEAVRPLTSERSKELAWNQWLAGVIDGDGSLLLSKLGYASLEITVGLKDEHALMQIKQKLGGSVKLRAGSSSVRYRLHNKKGILDVLSRINGDIRNTVRVEQLKKLCHQYDIVFIPPTKLSINNGWFAGFFDADGTIIFSIKGGTNPQITISVANKHKVNVLDYIFIFGGGISYDKTDHGCYKWSIQSEKDNLKMLSYFKVYPSRTSKQNRLFLVPLFYSLRKLRAYAAPETSCLFKAWQRFDSKWKHRC